MFFTLTAGSKLMSMEKWCDWALAHIAGKVPTIDLKKCDFANLDKSNKGVFLNSITAGVTKEDSVEATGLYNFLLCLFVEADEAGKGKITFDQFDILVTKAAAVPRFYGLAPEGQAQATRKEIFDNMKSGEGHIAFSDFLSWCRLHINQMIKDPTSKATV